MSQQGWMAVAQMPLKVVRRFHALWQNRHSDGDQNVESGRLERALLRPFMVDASANQVALIVAICRMLVGCFIFHQFLDVLGFSSMDPEAAKIQVHCVVALVASALLAVGFLTPLAVVSLLVLFSQYTLTSSLGDLITTILLWGLLFFGAGRAYALDALILRYDALRRFLEPLYVLAVGTCEPRGIAWSRLLLLGMYWGCCLSAMVFHTQDAFWLSGDVLPVVVTTPYVCDHHELMTGLRNEYPTMFLWACRLGLLAQVTWELLLFPLCYFRLGRVFVVIQGLLFFLGSLILMNLQYLPIAELCLWLLVFGPSMLARLNSPRKSAATPERPRPAWSIRIGFMPALGIAMAIVVLLQLTLCPYTLPASWGQHTAGIYIRLAPLYRALGQNAICVFNRDDVQMGATYVVIYETDPKGEVLRVVPLLDLNGARLSYMRNDLLYFRHSVGWQRSPLEMRFHDEDFSRPTTLTTEFVQRVAQLDARLNPAHRRRYYRASFYQRTLYDTEGAPRWSKAAIAAEMKLSISPSFYDDADGISVFSLPPGQVGEARRLAATAREGASSIHHATVVTPSGGISAGEEPAVSVGSRGRTVPR
jgi:hypothetical protein